MKVVVTEVLEKQKDAQLAKDTADLNLTYLLLAQRMLKADRSGAMLQLGVSSELADLLTTMSVADTVKMSSSSFLLCTFRFGELPIAPVVQTAEAVQAHKSAHMAIVMASRISDPRANRDLRLAA